MPERVLEIVGIAQSWGKRTIGRPAVCQHYTIKLRPLGPQQRFRTPLWGGRGFFLSPPLCRSPGGGQTTLPIYSRRSGSLGTDHRLGGCQTREPPHLQSPCLIEMDKTLGRSVCAAARLVSQSKTVCVTFTCTCRYGRAVASASHLAAVESTSTQPGLFNVTHFGQCLEPVPHTYASEQFCLIALDRADA